MEIAELIGKTLKSVIAEDDVVTFIADDGGIYKLLHNQECCERVYLADVIGDLSDLVGAPVVIAEERSNYGETEYGDSCKWTFYEIATSKGSVTLRWIGTSNGYYSVSVSFEKIK